MIGNKMEPETSTWATTPTRQRLKPRPATIHEGFSYCSADGFGGLPALDLSAISMQQQQQQQHTAGGSVSSSRPMTIHPDFDSSATVESISWVSKPCDDSFEVHGLDGDVHVGHPYTTEEAIPVLDLRYPPVDGNTMAYDDVLQPRRTSGSSFTISTSGGLSDMASYEDFSAALSDAPSFASDYPPPSTRTSLLSSTQRSPAASPRVASQTRSELVRTQSRGRASPSPRPVMRAAPYSVDGARAKRWSTGSYGTTPTRRPSPFVYHAHHNFPPHPRMSSRHSSPTNADSHLPLSFGNLQAASQHHYLVGNTHPSFRNNMLHPSPLPSHAFCHPDFETPPPLLPHGLFRMLQSNADPRALHGAHYADVVEAPDLFASLRQEPQPPPPEDMNPADPDLVPHEQDLRFDGDLYTPRWVRGHGNKREGWCGICKPGRWLVLKNSAFWYDKSFTHGISAATGTPFQGPQETRRMDGNPDVWEGLCGSCNEWIALVSSKKKGTTWFRHAYKCHPHPKVKDAPKRRRESGHSRALVSQNTAKPKTDHQATQLPLSPQLTPAASCPVQTPTTTPPSLQAGQSPLHQNAANGHQHLHAPPVPPLSSHLVSDSGANKDGADCSVMSPSPCQPMSVDSTIAISSTRPTHHTHPASASSHHSISYPHHMTHLSPLLSSPCAAHHSNSLHLSMRLPGMMHTDSQLEDGFANMI